VSFGHLLFLCRRLGGNADDRQWRRGGCQHPDARASQDSATASHGLAIASEGVKHG
jgi:hypothetical protein